MHLSLSNSNLVIILVAVAAIVANAVASSRLAPMIAAFFTRLEGTRRTPTTSRPSLRLGR
jgi:hypothetical protein